MTPKLSIRSGVGCVAFMLTVAALYGGTVSAQGFSSTLLYPTQHPFTGSGADPSVSIVVSRQSGTLGKTYAAWRTGDRVFYGTKTTGGAWSIDSTMASSNAWGVTLALQSSGEVPHIAYLNPADSTYGFVYATKVSGSWTTETILALDPTASPWGGPPSITLTSSSVPMVAMTYSIWEGDTLRQYIKVARRVSANNWSIDQAVVRNGYPGFSDVNIKSPTGTPHLTFNDLATYVFKYATKSPNWAIDSVGGPASQTAGQTLVVGSVPIVAYVDGNEQLVFAYRDPSLGWQKTSLRPAQHLVSLVDVGSEYVIAYASRNLDSVRVASRNASGSWNYQRVAPWHMYPPNPTDHPWLSVGGYSSGGSTTTHIAWANTSSAQNADFDEYDFATGVLTTNGNSRVQIAGDEDEPRRPASGGLSVVGSRFERNSAVAAVRMVITASTPERVRASLFDVSGRSLASRPWEAIDAGVTSRNWEIGNVKRGMYFLRVETTGGSSAVGKCVLLD
jgi:hypothetical protein